MQSTHATDESRTGGGKLALMFLMLEEHKNPSMWKRYNN